MTEIIPKLLSDMIAFYEEHNCPIPNYDYPTDTKFNSFIDSVDSGLGYALKVSAAVYTMASVGEIWQGLIDIYKSILRFNIAYKVHKMPESQKGYAIAFLFSELAKSVGKEPEYYMSDFPSMYGIDYEKEAREIITGLNNAIYGETGIAYGKVRNKVRQQFPAEYKEAIEKVNTIIAKIYAGDTDNIYIVYDDILDHLNIQSGNIEVGGDEFGGAIVVAAINDICNYLLGDDEYAKMQFDKYYTPLPSDIVLLKEKEVSMFDNVFQHFFEDSAPKDVYLVKHNEKTIGLSYDSFRLAKLNAMLKNKRE